MSRFYIKPEDIRGDDIYIGGDEAHHILDVMRLKRGDRVIAFDGLGNEYNGLISEAKRKSLVISIQSRREQPALKAKITLAQAIPRSEKMDYIVQKCTELGVSSIIPMVTERTVVKLDKSREARRRARWIKIATGAAKQCGRSDVPEIKKVLGFKDIFRSVENYALKIMPSLTGERKCLTDLVSNRKCENIIVFIGPEGGFSPKEIELAVDCKVNPVSLGPYILKSDTAAVATLAILNCVLNNA